MILTLLVLAVLAVLNAVAAAGVRAEFLTVTGAAGSGWLLPAVLYGAAAVALVVAAWLTWTGHVAPRRTALLVGLVLTVAAPLAYGALTHQFHASHHLVRLAVVAVAGVIAWRA